MHEITFGLKWSSKLQENNEENMNTTPLLPGIVYFQMPVKKASCLMPYTDSTFGGEKVPRSLSLSKTTLPQMRLTTMFYNINYSQVLFTKYILRSLTFGVITRSIPCL